MRVLSQLHKNEKGMTGLETAIILIAFVTVAAVFGYAVLSAGLFSAERGKETIYAGLNEAKSNLELSGSVIGKSDNSTQYLRVIYFSLKNAISGSPIDLTPCDGTENATNKCVISLATAKDYFSNVKWTKTAVGNDNGNNLLEQGEQFEILIDLTDLGTGTTLAENLSVNDHFDIQVKPTIGSTISIQRMLPPALEKIIDLH
jgi:archaeal flagellin FlaB